MKVSELRVGLLFYIVGTEHIYVNVLNQAGDQYLSRLAPVEHIWPSVDQLIRALQEPLRCSQSEIVETLKRLSREWGRLLLPPLESLEKFDVLVIVPHHFLHYLPFHLVSLDYSSQYVGTRFRQYWPDEVWEVIPSQMYAQTLTAWLKGEIDCGQVERYLAVIEQVREYEEIRKVSNEKVDWSFYLRMISLSYVLARELNRFEGEISKERELEVWHSLWSQVTRMRGQYHLNPHRPDLSGTLNYPLFHMVEHGLAAEASEGAVVTARCEEMMNEMERCRAAALSYSLTVSPPLVAEDKETALGDLLNDERELLQWLRGAFFLTHYEFLPDHFRRFATDYGEYMGGDDPKRLFNLETGRKEYLEVKKRLDAVAEKMKPLAPEYCMRRKEPCAGMDRIIGALRRHSLDASASN